MSTNDTPAQAVIKAAMSIAKDAAEGRIAAADLDAAAADAVRELAGTVAGPDDPLWDVQLSIARQVLAVGGVPANELAEWLAVMRAAEDEPEAGPSWIVRALEMGADDEETPEESP